MQRCVQRREMRRHLCRAQHHQPPPALRRLCLQTHRRRCPRGRQGRTPAAVGNQATGRAGETERADIEKYCEEMELNPKFDESNKDNTYTRNKIRNVLIPFLKEEFNPSVVEGLNRLSSLASQENKYIEEIVNKEYANILVSTDSREIVLKLKEFNALDEFIKGRIILLCVFNLFGSTKGIEKKHIEDIIKLCERNIGNKYLTPNKNIKFFVGQGNIVITRQ